MKTEEKVIMYITIGVIAILSSTGGYKYIESFIKTKIFKKEIPISSNVIEPIVTKWDAIRNWKESLNKKLKEKKPLYTTDLQDAIKPNTNIVITGKIRDIEKIENNLYVLHTQEILNNKQTIRISMVCNELQYSNIMMYPINDKSNEKYIFILKVNKIYSIRNPAISTFVNEGSNYYWSNVISIISGECLELVTPSKYKITAVTDN